MSDDGSEAMCLVDFHGGHVKPRLFALHERGRLWYFDLCFPHETPGDHWSALKPFSAQDQSGGRVFSQSLDGDDLFLRTTGYRPLEFKAEFCALLAWTLGNVSEPTNITVRFLRSKIVDWPPSIPDKFVTGDLASYDLDDDAVTFHIKAISDIRDLLIFYQHDASHVYVQPMIDQPDSHISFQLEDEQWYLNYDNDAMASMVKSVCGRFDVELIIHHEKLADHRPHADAFLRRLGERS